QNVLCAVNVQHNCVDSKCTKLSGHAIQQEWTVTRQIKHVIQHEPTQKYLLNAFSIHNYSFIHAVILPSL
ncbi:hypothetical protein M404DRAFT_109058, partial [Pisolithus tinctorius Marx 270]